MFVVLIIQPSELVYGTRRARKQTELQESKAHVVAPDTTLLEPQISRFPVPPPVIRQLPNMRTSFIVPLAWLECGNKKNLNLDVIVSPAVWPLRIVLSRPMGASSWARIEITADIIEGADLPPLLTCSPASALHPGDSGGTCETNAVDSGQLPDLASTGRSSRAGAWLEIQSGRAGTRTAAIVMSDAEGCYFVQRTGYLDWNLDAHLDGDQPCITVSKQGKDIGLAAKSGLDNHQRIASDEEYMKFQTRPDTSSPESLLLLMSMLAVMVFGQ